MTPISLEAMAASVPAGAAGRARFSLESLHAGFEFDIPQEVPATPDATEQGLALPRGPVCDAMLETCPEFCAPVFERKPAA
jgi:glutaconate CoA-transferase subunit B